MKVFSENLGHEAYLAALTHLLENSNPHFVRDLEMESEETNVILHVKNADSLDFDFDARPNTRIYKYVEALWDLGPSASISVLKKFNKNIVKYVEDQPEQKETPTWAYGPTIAHQIPGAIYELRKDPTSRRAVISMPRSFYDIKKGTPPCLVSIQFFIRNNKLNATAVMRSNDIWLGLPLDMFQFGLMQAVVAGALGLPLGTYTHFAGSMHLYSKDKEVAKNLLESNSTGINRSYPQFVTIAPEEIRSGALSRHLLWITDSNRYEPNYDYPNGSCFKYYLDQLVDHLKTKADVK